MILTEDYFHWVGVPWKTDPGVALTDSNQLSPYIVSSGPWLDVVVRVAEQSLQSCVST